MDRELLAALAAVAGVIGGKALDLVVARVKRHGDRAQSESALFAEETRKFRHELAEEVRGLRAQIDALEQENDKLRHDLNELREVMWRVSRENTAFKASNEQMVKQIARLTEQIRVLEGRPREE